MDLSVKLTLRAQAEGTSAIRSMKQETAELAAAMREVRQAARSGGQVSPSSIKALGGFKEFQEAFAKVQKELAEPVKAIKSGGDEERLFRGRLRMTDQQAKVRLAESARVAKAESANAARSEADQQREAQGTLQFRQRMWAQQQREAESEARAETRAVEESAQAQRRAAEETLQANMRYWAQRGRMAREAETAEARAAIQEARRRREMLRGYGLGMFAGPASEGEEHGGRGGHGRSLVSEFKTAAGYTLVYGGINKALEGLSAVARSPLSLARMTLDVADHVREIKEGAANAGISTRQFQDLQYSLAAKGISPEHVEPMMNFLMKNAVAGIRHPRGAGVGFQALGMSVKQLRADSREPYKALIDIGDALERIRNPSKKVAIADMIFGRDGYKYLDLFKGGFLKTSAAEAERTGATMSDATLDAGQRVSDQWKELKLQMAGIRNETAGAAFPIMSDLLGSASNWLNEHRAVISSIIKTDMAELKADLPIIKSDLKGIANGALEVARDLGPMVHLMAEISNSSFMKYMASGQIIPGGVDLGDAKHADATRRKLGQNSLANLLDPTGVGRFTWAMGSWAAHQGESAAASLGHVEVTVKAAPGTSVTSITSRGNVRASRGEVRHGG